MQTVAPMATPYHGPLAAYAVVNLQPQPLAPLYLKAVDPFTGADVPGHPPLELGHDGTWALSPDGATMALGWAPKDSGGWGPQRLFLVDLRRWQRVDLGFEALISRLFWSPDGGRIYVTTRHRCSAPECVDSSSELVTIDSTTGAVLAQVELPFSSYQTYLSPDGASLYLFGGAWVDPRYEEPPVPRLVAFDMQKGRVRGELALRDLLYGSRKETDASGDYYAQYLPGIAMSPDGQRMYIAHPDRNRIDVVDPRTMRLERSAEVRRPSSLIDRFLSFFAGEAEAKGGPTNGAALYISADGRLLYYGRHGERPPADANGNYQSTDTGLQVVGAGSFHVLIQLDPSPPNQFHAFLSEASEQYTFTLRGIQLVVRDPRDLHVLSSGDIGAVYDLLVGPAPPASR